jgi:large subunit ribosomal protein L29
MASSTVLAEISDEDLINMLDSTKDDLLNLRFQNVTGQLDNNALITATKRDIARLRTELRAREIAEAEALEEANDG